MNGRSSLSSPYPSTGFLRQAQDRQGERTGKALSDRLPSTSSGRRKANGLKNMASFDRRQVEQTGKPPKTSRHQPIHQIILESSL
ncbi:MAG: hypothetical protein LBD67_05240 [Candidatus Accumulibacter sp.]|nr:hypothetical protein [Accumulibacter sp.]